MMWPLATSIKQKKLSVKQVRWQDFLAELDLDFGYKAGKAKQVADALSRKEKLSALSKLEGIRPDQKRGVIRWPRLVSKLLKREEQKSFK